MLVGWTPLGSPVIFGLQGRYVIAGLILLLLCMRNRIFVCRGNAERELCLAFTGWQTFTILFILMQVPVESIFKIRGEKSEERKKHFFSC